MVGEEVISGPGDRPHVRDLCVILLMPSQATQSEPEGHNGPWEPACLLSININIH